MDNKYILLVSDNEKGFFVNAIKAALTKSDLKVQSVAVKSQNLMEYFDGAFGVFIADSFENTVILNTIKNKCYEQNKKLILYGSPEGLQNMKRVFVDSMIYGEFTRNSEMGDIVNRVVKLKNRVEKQSIMKKILVVDDNGVLLRTIKEWLEDKYTVSLSNSAESAEKAISKSVPDLILLDYEMPVCSGVEFMTKLSGSRETRDIPIIFLTSRNDEKTVKEVMQLKPKGYILKTTPQEQLLKKLDDFFESVDNAL